MNIIKKQLVAFKFKQGLKQLIYKIHFEKEKQGYDEVFRIRQLIDNYSAINHFLFYSQLQRHLFQAFYKPCSRRHKYKSDRLHNDFLK
jgi:hypothetical protein